VEASVAQKGVAWVADSGVACKLRSRRAERHSEESLASLNRTWD